MSEICGILNRIRSLLPREKLQQEIQDEIQSHLEFQMRKYRCWGCRRMRREGRHTSLSAERGKRSRNAATSAGFRFLKNALRDCRHALRAFRRAPAIVLAAVLTIAVGVGANSTVFAFCNAMLLATLPVLIRSRLCLISIELPVIRDIRIFPFLICRRAEGGKWNCEANRVHRNGHLLNTE